MKTPSVLDLKNLKGQPRELSRLCKKLFAGGKSVRSRLIDLISARLGLKAKETAVLCRIVEYVHNSSLLHDDLIDRSLVRRRQKAAWVEFSPAQAVLAGDYLLAQVNIYLAETGNKALLRLTAESIVSLVKGEFLQREIIKNRTESLKDTDRISNLKTASLFKWSLKAPFLWKGGRDPRLFALLDTIGRNCGLLFQRSDDLLDFSVRNREKKTVLRDLKQDYLNSFSRFLIANKGENFSAKLRRAGTRTAVERLIPDFRQRLADFDSLNSKLIKKTEKSVERLRPFLRPKERALTEDLKPVPARLYWRDF